MTAQAFMIERDSTAALQGFVDACREMTGFLDGAIGEPLPGWYVPGADNRAVLAGLYEALAARYPEAGPAFWAVRVWTNLNWQPAYLAVYGIHMLGVLPDLLDVSQRIAGIHAAGYRLPLGDMTRGETSALIALAGKRLRAMADGMLTELNTIAKMKPLPARRLLADRMLGLMVRLSHKRPDLSAAQMRDFSDQWLAAMGLTGQGDLETISLANGRDVVISARKGCCLDYLIDADVYCSTCPKQDDGVRIARQRADAEKAFAEA